MCAYMRKRPCERLFCPMWVIVRNTQLKRVYALKTCVLCGYMAICSYGTFLSTI